MLRDPFAVELSTYLEASNRHSEAVHALNELVGQNRHAEFEQLHLKVRELAAEMEQTHAALKQHRRDVLAKR
jgi:hypothetical protein